MADAITPLDLLQPPAAAAPAATPNPLDQIMQVIAQQAQMRQQQVEQMQPHNILQGALQAMATNPARESPLGDFLLSLLMGATGTPNPMTAPARMFAQKGRGGTGFGGVGMGSLGDILRLATLPQQQEAMQNKLALQRAGLQNLGMTNEAMAADLGVGGPGTAGAPTAEMGFKRGYAIGPSGTRMTLTPKESPTDIATKARARAQGAASVQAPSVLMNQGMPYAVKDPASGKTYAFDDPAIPPDLKSILDASTKAHALRLAQLTGPSRTMIEKAPSVIDLAQKSIELVNQNQQKLGPVRGRIREFTVGTLGAKDPSFQALRTNLSLLSSLLLQMHVGSRGGQQMIQRFDKKLTAAGPDPDNLKSTLNEIIAYANEKIAQGQAAGMGAAAGTTPTPGATAQPKPAPTPRVGEVIQLPGLPPIRRVE